MLLLGAFQALLHRYSGQTDIRVGVPIANRNRAEIEGLIGFFVNTQVLRAELDGQTPFDAIAATRSRKPPSVPRPIRTCRSSAWSRR